MAFASLNGGFLWPDFYGNALNATLSEQSILLDANGEKAAFIFVAPKTGNIDRVHVRVSAFTSNSTLTLTLETVDATNGRPTGTLVGSGATGTFAVTGVGQANVTFGATLPAVTKGTQYALVVTQGTPGNCSVSVWRAGAGAALKFNRMVYSLSFTGGAWTALSATLPTSDRPNCGIRYDDGNYYYVPGVLALSAFTQTAFNSTSDPVERGMFFTLPFPARVAGWYWIGASQAGNWDVILAQTDGTALATFSGDKDQVSFYGSTSTGYTGCTMGYFSSPVNLAISTKYYLTIKPSTATNISVQETTLLDTSIAAMMGMYNGGTAVGQLRRAAAGTYTETTTARPYGMGLIFDAFSDGAGAGGMLINPGLSGGLR